MLLEILVAAAASARPPLEAARIPMERAAREKVVLRFGATGSFARQIENGAPFDLFFAADEATPRKLAAEGLLVPGSLRIYLEGRLVLARSAESRVALPTLVDVAFLRTLPGARFKRLAMAAPKVAPYGRAAVEALSAAGVRAALEGRLIAAGNAEEALAYVASGNAELGFVPATLAERTGLAFAPVDPALHAPIRHVAGVVAASKRRAAALRALEASLPPR